MLNLEKQLLDVLVDMGYFRSTSKLKIYKIECDNQYSDYRTVICGEIPKRCRKPVVIWNLKVDIVRELIYFDKSTFFKCDDYMYKNYIKKMESK